MTDLHNLDISEVAQLIQRGSLSPVALTTHMLDRIERLDSSLHAFATVTHEFAIEQAKLAEARLAKRQYLGPLHGVPIGLKDLCFTQGIPTSAGMPLHQNFVPDFDGTATLRLRNAGAVLLGKLQLTEGAFTEHHPDIAVPVNPWDENTWSGASSTGSGVSLAAGMCFGATGSDTGGSIRFPCAATGTTGIKPTWGRVSVHGAFELAASLDHLGAMGKSATDCAILLQEMAGADVNDPACSQAPVPNYLDGDITHLRDIRIGVDESFNSCDVDMLMRNSVSDSSRALIDAGARIVPVSFPDYQSAIEDWGPICAIEAAYAHRRTFPAKRAAYGSTLRDFLDQADGLSAADYQAMLLRRRAFSGQLENLLHSVDALLIPAQTTASPTIGQMAALGNNPSALAALIRFTAPIDMSGHPSLTMPCGFTDRQTPVAMQLIGRYFSEDVLFRIGRVFQRSTDWHRLRCYDFRSRY